LGTFTGHLHCIWTLPEGDNDFSIQRNLIKSRFSKSVKSSFHRTSLLNDSKQKLQKTTIWQRRFWELQIRMVSTL
jgi:putative transposase